MKLSLLLLSLTVIGITRAQLCNVKTTKTSFLCINNIAEIELEYFTLNSNTTQYEVTFESLSNTIRVNISAGLNNKTILKTYNLTCPSFSTLKYKYKVIFSSIIPKYNCTTSFNITRCGNDIIDPGEECDLDIGGGICNNECNYAKVNGTCNLVTGKNISVCPSSGIKNISLEWNDTYVPDINVTNATHRAFYQYDNLPPIYMGEITSPYFYNMTCSGTQQHSIILVVSGVANFFCKSTFYFTVCGNGIIDSGEECDYNISGGCNFDCKCIYGLNTSGICLLSTNITPITTNIPTISPTTNTTNTKTTTLTYAIIVMTVTSIVMTLGILSFICKYSSAINATPK